MLRFDYRRLLPDKIRRADYLILLPIMVLAGYLAFIPHQNYPFPVHIDEWVHLAYAKALMAQGETAFVDPFFGQTITGLSGNLETGFHLILGVFQQISGLSWLTIFRYFPSFMFILTVLSVYVFAHREGFGWEAAFFTCLIPTTVGILGPAFLVPVSMALPFIPLAIFIAFNFRHIWSYVSLFLITVFLLFLHAPSALSLVIILGCYILLNLKRNYRHSLGIVSALIIPFILPFPWIINLLLPTAKELFVPQLMSPYVQWPKVLTTYGYLPVAVSLLGAFVLTRKGGRERHALVLGLLSISLMLAIFYTLHYGIEIVYARGLMYMMLMLSIIAGAGLMAVKEFKLPERISRHLKWSFLNQHFGRMACLVLIGLTLVFAIPARQDTPYYRMIDAEDYAAFKWIEGNIGANYAVAILDPWKATAFTAITGKKVYTRIHLAPFEKDKQANAFLEAGCDDSVFLREHGISIVYSRLPCRNPDLIEVRENVYLLKTTE